MQGKLKTIKFKVTDKMSFFFFFFSQSVAHGSQKDDKLIILTETLSYCNLKHMEYNLRRGRYTTDNQFGVD